MGDEWLEFEYSVFDNRYRRRQICIARRRERGRERGREHKVKTNRTAYKTRGRNQRPI